MRRRLEYALAWIVVKTIGAMPRWLARACGILLGWSVYALHFRLRRVGMRNLRLALPGKKRREHSGILLDTNMTPPQGVFVPFFGIPACTASGLARIALRTDAAVVPGFTIWDPVLRKYRLRFDPALPLIRTGDDEADAVANTALFSR